jgi:hypothetical protein
MGPRVNLSVLLILSGAVLLAAIALGDRMGNRVLLQVAERTEVEPSPQATPVAEVKDRQVTLGWKRAKLVSVATDPAFPDPRVTPFARPSAPAHRSRKHDRRPAQSQVTGKQLSPLRDNQGEPVREPGTPIPYATPQR